MTNLSNRIHVLWSMLTFQSKHCPYCQSRATRRIGSNAYLFHVRECADCHLMYRWPKQTDKFNKVFYQLNYIRLASENMHLPTLAEAGDLVKQDFKGHATALGIKRDLVQELKPSGRLCVYGANWGYEVAQLARIGFDAIGYEVSLPRAEFAARLGVSVLTELDAIRAKAPFDIVYCSHTLEHLPTPDNVFKLFADLCAPTGCLVIFVPNCGGDNARKHGLRWGPFSSSLHPLSYRADFFKHALPKYGFRSVSSFSDPYDLARIHNLNSQDNLPGDELLIVARKTPACS
jgi:hypothetical protein